MTNTLYTNLSFCVVYSLETATALNQEVYEVLLEVRVLVVEVFNTI